MLRENGISVEVIGAAFSLEKAVVLGLLILTTVLSVKTGPRSFKLMHVLTLLLGVLLILFSINSNFVIYLFLVPLFTAIYMGLRPFNRTLVNMIAPRKTLGSFVGLLNIVTRGSVIVSITLYGVMLELLGFHRSIWILFGFVMGALLLQIALVRGVVTSRHYDIEGGRERSDYSLRDSIVGLKEIIYNPVIIYIAITFFFEAGVPVYLSIIIWDLLGGPLPTSIGFIVIEVGGLVFAPTMGVISDRVNRPVMFIVLSEVVLALGYALLSLGYYVNSYATKVMIVVPALLAFSLSPALYNPNLHKFVQEIAGSGSKRLTVFSSIDLMTGLLSIPAPIISGILIEAIGYSHYLLAMALLVTSVSVSFMLMYIYKTKK